MATSKKSSRRSSSSRKSSSSKGHSKRSRSTKSRRAASSRSSHRKSSSGSSHRKKSSARKYGKKAQKKVGKVMHEFKHGQLKSGGRRKVKSRKQAIAIGISEARREGDKVPKRSSTSKSHHRKAA